MRTLRLILVAAVAVAAATTATVASAGTKTIKIGDNWFVDDKGGTKTVTVTEGATIKWKWTGDDEHNVRPLKVPAGVKKSRFKASTRVTGTFSRKVTVPGTYKFECSIHDYDGQFMTLKVRAK
jgi:plastocyanin